MAASRGAVIIPLEIKVRLGILRYVAHIRRRRETEERNIQFEMLNASLCLTEDMIADAKEKNTTPGYAGTVRESLNMFGLDEESFTKLTKVKEKNNFRKFLLGDGLTTASRG